MGFESMLTELMIVNINFSLIIDLIIYYFSILEKNIDITDYVFDSEFEEAKTYLKCGKEKRNLLAF